jgi:hypothetical protein
MKSELVHTAFKFGIEFEDLMMALKNGIKFHIPFNPVTVVPKVLKNEAVGEMTLIQTEVLNFGKML